MQNRQVIVTGAAGGMGCAVCARLLSEGWTVIAIDSHAERLKSLEDKLHKEAPIGKLTTLEIDLTVPDLEETVGGSIDPTTNFTGLVNLAGISVGDTIGRLTDSDWNHSFEVNVSAAMRLSRLCAPLMARSGSGSIVNVSSPVAYIGARKPSYAASKAALIGLTMSLARNLGPDNIRVNILLPGATTTNMTKDWTEEKISAVANSNFLQRMCSPTDVAGVISFLLGDDSSYMTGAVVDLTAGGMVGH